MFYYIYVLKSIKDGKLYIGKTKDLKKRVDYHNKGFVKATKNRRPLMKTFNIDLLRSLYKQGKMA